MNAVNQTENIDQPIVIVHIIQHLMIGGLENGLVNLINELPEERYRHVIVCLKNSSEFEQRIKRQDVDIYSLNKKKGKDLSVYFKLFRLLRKIKPSIVHTRNIGTVDCSIIAMLAGVKNRIHSEHGWEVSDLYGSSKKYKLIRKVCSKFIQTYIALSEDILSWLTNKIGIQTEKCVLIYNGVDTKRFCYSDKNEKRIKKEIGIGEDEIVIGSVGRLQPIKDYESLVRSFIELRRLDDLGALKLRLVIVGGGPCLEDLRNIVKNNNCSESVLFLGARDDIADILSVFSIFALTSLNEGISNTILEAMSTGLPTVATNVGGNGELIEHEKTGLLIPKENVMMLTGALKRLVTDRIFREKLSKNARMYIKHNHSLEAMTENYAKVYENICH